MSKMSPEQEAAYALDFGVARSDLPEDVQLAYDRLLQERKERAESQQATSRQQEVPEPGVSGDAMHQDMSIPDTMQQEHRRPPPGIVLKTFGGGAGNILLGVALIGGGHSAGAAVFGVLFILLGVATWILGGFGRRPWDEMPPAHRAIAGTGAVIGMLFLYVLFFWFFILRLVWKYIIDPGLRS
jgi:hypothetical protein